MQRRGSAVLGTSVLALAFALVAPGQRAAAAAASVPTFDHVVVVVEENKAATQVVGNPAAPYINSLANSGANFTSSYAVAHPSEPNYLALFSGSTQGLTDDSCPHTYSTPSLGDRLIAAGRTFVGYSESQPSAGYTGCGSGTYARKHNPWSDFPAVPASSNQPFTAFPSDYASLPAVSFVIPNLQNDMHDGTIAQGDAWLQSNMGGYVDWARTHNSLLVLTWDEDDNSAGNRISTVFAGQSVVAGKYGETIDHYRVLRTIEDAFGVTPVGASANVAPITDVFTTGPSPAFVLDTFGRTVANGWGRADVGGAWTTVGTSSAFAVSGGSGTVTLPKAGVQLAAYLPTAARTDADVTERFAVSAVPAGGPVYLTLEGRRVSSGNEYSAKVLVNPDRSVTIRLIRVMAGTEAAIAGPVKVPGITYAPGAVLDLRTQVTGTNPTQLRARTWLDGTTEPSTWPVTTTDATSALQVPGVVGVVAYLSSAATNAPITTTVSRVEADPTVVVDTPPVASFTASCTQLQCAFDGSGSSDDHGVASWTWDFGDGTSGAGVTASHVYASGGSYLVALTVTDAAGGTNTTSRQVTVTAPPPNAPPMASFTASCTQLQCAFDGSGSSDDHGVASWAWDFGDGTSGSGTTASHTYANAGSYQVTLTVADAAGLTDSTGRQVAVTAAAPPIASDAFQRTVSSGFGTADVGGAWSLVGPASYASVSGGRASIRLPSAGTQLVAYLPSATAADVDLTGSFGLDAVPAGGPVYVTFSGRRVGSGNEYSAKLLVNPDGSVTLRLIRVAGNLETAIANPVRVPGITYTAGTSVAVRLQVTGTGPTTLRARAWAAGSTEPSTWTVTASDSTAALQVPGSVGLIVYASRNVTNAPLTASFGPLVARSTTG